MTVSPEQMYALLLEVRDNVVGIKGQVGVQTTSIADHEARLRAIESEEDSTRRITQMEHDVRAIRSELESIKRKVYAIPSASVVVAFAALVLSRWP